jgi:uncharacterized protein (DUF1810 family)
MSDPRAQPPSLDAERFLAAQDPVWADVLSELRAGRKTSHWMWFVFPQLSGLGRSSTSQYFALDTLDDARAYLAQDVLGPRLREATTALLAAPGDSAESILGPVDAVKLRSSMTLFLRAAPDECLFADVLDRFFGGQPDARTDDLLASTRFQPGSGS